MPTEINFRKTSSFIPHLYSQGYKLSHLDRYPTSRNAQIWHSYESQYLTVYTLVSYNEIPVKYYEYHCPESAEIKISIAPDKLTSTTRRHIYAFIRQYVPAKQAKVIINTARITFALPPMSKNRYTGESIYEMIFDVYPE